MKVELKLYVTERLKNRIKMIAEEKGLSMNEYATMLLEKGLYKEFEEEMEYGKIEFKQVDSEWYRKLWNG